MMYLIFSLVYVPAFLLKGRHRSGLRQRFGWFAPALRHQWCGGSPVIWLHAVSVGEINAAEPLIHAVRAQVRGCRFVLSTVTPTGNAQARRLARTQDSVIYFPFDLSFVVRRVLRHMRPRLIIIMETELWPNLIHAAARQHIPLVIANGRISDTAYPLYRKFVWIFRPALRRVNWCCVQSETDRSRIITLGADPARVTVTGNLKFDQAAAEDGPLPDWGIGPHERLIIAGSTHDPEEEMIIRVYLRLRKEHPNLRLMLAPRHPQRGAAVAAMVIRYGLEAYLFSGEAPLPKGKTPVLILDIMGVLRQAYRQADIVVIGGSLVKHGGQNPIEAAVWAKPVVFGSYMFNFSGISTLFLQQEAAVQARDEAELRSVLEALLADEAYRLCIGARAQRLVEAQRGSVGQVMRTLSPFWGAACAGSARAANRIPRGHGIIARESHDH